jgi:hypothetical protein
MSLPSIQYNPIPKVSDAYSISAVGTAPISIEITDPKVMADLRKINKRSKLPDYRIFNLVREMTPENTNKYASELYKLAYAKRDNLAILFINNLTIDTFIDWSTYPAFVCAHEGYRYFLKYLVNRGYKCDPDTYAESIKMNNTDICTDIIVNHVQYGILNRVHLHVNNTHIRNMIRHDNYKLLKFMIDNGLDQTPEHVCIRPTVTISDNMLSVLCNRSYYPLCEIAVYHPHTDESARLKYIDLYKRIYSHTKITRDKDNIQNRLWCYNVNAEIITSDEAKYMTNYDKISERNVRWVYKYSMDEYKIDHIKCIFDNTDHKPNITDIIKWKNLDRYIEVMGSLTYDEYVTIRESPDTKAFDHITRDNTSYKSTMNEYNERYIREKSTSVKSDTNPPTGATHYTNVVADEPIPQRKPQTVVDDVDDNAASISADYVKTDLPEVMSTCDDIEIENHKDVETSTGVRSCKCAELDIDTATRQRITDMINEILSLMGHHEA